MADPTYMDCWNFIVPLIPIDNETARQVYIMTFMATLEIIQKIWDTQSGLYVEVEELT